MSSMETIFISDIPVSLVKSCRARRVFLKQNTKGEIILTCPKLCPKILAISFAKTQKAWILAHAKYAPKEQVFSPNEKVCILGKEYLLISGKRTEMRENQIIVAGEPAFFHRRVCSCAQKILLPYIQTEVERLTALLGVKVHKITLRNTSSRWGSCSSRKNLSFCWKIAFAPKEVADYLIAHEVAHLVQMNHSAAFWQTVDRLTDQRRFAESWLKKNERELQSIR